MRRICVFCGSSCGTKDVFRRVAREVGSAAASRGLGVVYGGGVVGLMGLVADAALAAGAEVIGVIPRSMASKEIAHQSLTQLHVVEGMHPRKAMMARLSDAFLALPGGFGTYEELFEVITWRQLGFQDKPIGVLNVDGYFDPLRELIDNAVRHGFISERNRSLATFGAEPENLLEELCRRFPARPRVDLDEI